MDFKNLILKNNSNEDLIHLAQNCKSIYERHGSGMKLSYEIIYFLSWNRIKLHVACPGRYKSNVAQVAFAPRRFVLMQTYMLCLQLWFGIRRMSSCKTQKDEELARL